MDGQRHDEAIGHYSAALSIHPANTERFFIMRGKVYLAKGSWDDAIDEAQQVRWSCHVQVHLSTQNYQAISLDPSSPWGYEMKRAALHQAGRYDDAIQTFETMLSKMAHSPDLHIRGEYPLYCVNILFVDLVQ